MKATKTVREESGQALLELSMAALLLCVLIFGIIDFGRAIYDVQVMKNLAGEGSSMASRGSGTNWAATVASTVANDAGSDLAMSSNGCVIVTIVTNDGSNGKGGYNLTITDQASDGTICGASKIGTKGGQATLPTAAQQALEGEPTGSNLGVTEVFYNYSPITPVMGLLGSGALPSQFYTVAYY